MNVRVWKSIENSATAEMTEYADVSAIGIGHIKKDLVLVPADGKPIEAGTDWTVLEIRKEG